jgi:hypothetical protein
MRHFSERRSEERHEPTRGSSFGTVHDDFGIDYDEQIVDEELGIDVTEAPVPVSPLAPPIV